jgi:hypothetical protein
VVLAAVRGGLERNGFDGPGKPGPAAACQASTITFNVSNVKFWELSDEGLDLVGQVLKAIKASQQLVIDVPMAASSTKACVSPAGSTGTHSGCLWNDVSSEGPNDSVHFRKKVSRSQRFRPSRGRYPREYARTSGGVRPLHHATTGAKRRLSGRVEPYRRAPRIAGTVECRLGSEQT